MKSFRELMEKEELTRSDYKLSPSGRKSHKYITMNSAEGEKEDDKEDDKKNVKEETEEQAADRKMQLKKFKDLMTPGQICPNCAVDPCICDDSHGFVKEGSNDHYADAEAHKNKASKALETSDMAGHHLHMSNHHEAMGRWHDDKGRHSSADREYAKAEDHHEKGLTASKVPSRSLKSEEFEIDEATDKVTQRRILAQKQRLAVGAIAKEAAKRRELERKQRLARSKRISEEQIMKEEAEINEMFNMLAEAATSIDKGEYDYEGQMARTQLQTTMRNCEDLIDMIEDDENMPEWVQSKITLAQDYITTVRDYLQSKEELGEQAPVAPSLGVHRVAVTTSEPYHPMVTKRKETTQRFVKVTTNSKERALEKGMKHFKRKGFKVHGAEHVGMMHEEVLDEVLDPSMGAGEYVKDFQKSKAPQFKNKSKEKRRMMGIAAYLQAKRSAVSEELKGKQHKIDKNKNGKIDAHDFKLLRKEEETFEEIDEKISTAQMGHAGKTTIKHIDNPGVQLRMAAHDVKPGIKGYRDRIALLKAAQAQGKLKEEIAEEIDEEIIDEFSKDTLYSYANKADKDIAKRHKELGAQIRANKPVDANKNSMKISNRDKGLDRAETRLNKEEVELDEAINDNLHPAAAALLKHIKPEHHAKYTPDLTTKHYTGNYADRTAVLKAAERAGHLKEDIESIDELSKSTLGSYVKKASRDAVITRKIGADFENQAKKARSPGMKAASDEISQKYKEKSWKRRDGVDKAVDRLTKEEVEQIEEANHREFAQAGKMHPDMAKHMKSGQEMDFYHSKTGDKISGVVTKNTGTAVHIQANKGGRVGGGELHKFSVSKNLGGTMHEETEMPMTYKQFMEAMWPGTAEYKKKFDTERTTGAGARHDIKDTGKGVIATRRFSDNDTAAEPTKTAEPTEKRGRGRPAGASGAAYKARTAEVAAAARAKAAATKAANKNK